jgi:DNA-binding CsgD family transcriptional regulator/PAS domain-containing protein
MAQIAFGKESPLSVTSLVSAIHSAGVHADEWPGVLECLRTYLDAQVLTLGHHAFTSGVDSAWLESPQDARLSEEMAAFSARNPWFMSSEVYVPGRVMCGEELITHNELRRTDFYREFLHPRGLLHRLCGVVSKNMDGVFCLFAYRTEHRGAFGKREKVDLQILLGHITLALESHWRWQEADELARALMALIDHDSNAVILVTGDAIPIYRNPAAEHLLVEQVGLRLDGDHLVAASAADQRQLREAIHHVSQINCESARALPSVVRLACTPPTPPVVAVVRAAGQVFMRQAGVRRGMVQVTVRGSQAEHDSASCAFAQQYELTAAQAKVSALVFDGQTLSEIALALKVSENTVRSHLTQIFQKTHTHSQMDLVHLHARVCPALR